MSECLPEASISRPTTGISRDDLIRMAGNNSYVRWAEACDLRPDVCGKAGKLLPEGYVYYGEGLATEPLLFYLDGGVLHATSVDSKSVAVLTKFGVELGAEVHLRTCSEEDLGSRFTTVATVVGLALAACLLVALWMLLHRKR